MIRINRLLSSISFSLLILLLFLVFFRDRISVPPIVQVLGRGHVLALHIPIGMLVLICFLSLFKKESFTPLYSDLLSTGTRLISFFALLTALFGLFLSKEGDYDPSLLTYHQWWGIGIAILSYILSQFTISDKVYTLLIWSTLLVTVIGSHLGATLTHGDGFLLKPLQKEVENTSSFDESASFYQNAIFPIFENKCVSCHNPKKMKGELDLTTIEKIRKGGKHGAIIDFNKLPESRLIEYLKLPEDNKKHMPPQGKPQLNESELALVDKWILQGADFDKKWSMYTDNDTLRILADKVIIKKPASATDYPFEAAGSALIESLNDPYVSIYPIYQDAPALRADFFVRARYNDKKLIDLQKIKDQLVELNLGNMPVKDEEIKNITGFTNLQKLILTNSLITDKSIVALSVLPKLTALSLSGTSITKESIKPLNQSASLKEVFVWNTSIKKEDIDTTAGIHYYIGYVPDTAEIQKLNVPQIKNESTILDKNDSVRLYHRIPGVTIRYTLNDSLPDTIQSDIYTRPLQITNHTTVKARAMKEGWLSSPPVAFSFFQKGIQPIHTRLLTNPNEKYRGEGSELLTNNVKGNIGNLIDGNWLGFRENHMEALFEFDGNTTIHEILISYNNSINGYLMPPVSVELFTGNDTSNMKLVKKIIPPAVTEKDNRNSRNETISMNDLVMKSKFVKLRAINYPKLPKWHRGKGEKGWLFVDEVFFY